MSSTTVENSSVMKDNKHYNLNSKSQLAAIQQSFVYIEKAVEQHNVSLNPIDIFFIVDYGCSQGANSVVAIQTIIQAIQRKYGTITSDKICTVLNDLPSNDWLTLFQTFARLSFSCLASGKSFYEQILPSNTVQFGYTSTAIHWLSKKPCNLSRHCFAFAGQSTDEEKTMWGKQAAEDYELFLQHRSNELKKGAILVSVNLSRDSSNDTANRPLYHNLYRSAMSVLDEDELLNFNILHYYHSLEELTDPILLKEVNFEVICADLRSLPQPLYEDYCSKIIDFKLFVEKFTEFVRSWSELSLISCLRKDRTEKERLKIIEDFWNEYRNGMQVQGAEHFQNNPNQSYVILRKL
ncbi:unnamed protein product [Rotaria sp. Silwood2]|nr:unnamed protein product [Rotaria sp. Silwood2]